MAKDVIVACDFPTAAETFTFLDQFTEIKPYVKIGMELFYGEGPDVVRGIKERGHRIFLDLKLHDIPNTVKRAMKNLALLGVDMTNLHAGGGSGMMEAALEGLDEGSNGKRPLLIAVTLLTSISEEQMNNELMIPGPLKEAVTSYASNAVGAGLDGVVCSPLEVDAVKAGCGQNFLTVTPGIRFKDGEPGDQSRLTTPEKAARMGSDYIVMGRAITLAENPVATYERAVRDFLDA